MKIVVNDDGRNQKNQCDKLLIVTSEATHCEVQFNPESGFVCVHGGSIWPGSLPDVFSFGKPTAQVPVNVRVKQEILDHFHGSVAPLTINV